MMEERISDESFNVSAIAENVGMSRSCLFSKMKTLTGMSPQEFLINYRLNKAREMILSRRYNVSEVAYNVGFSTLNGFSRAFKNKFGIPPSAI
jgi:AraC-like DNA-binding protein